MSDETDNAITLSQLLAASPMRVTVAGTARLQTEAARLCDELEAATKETDLLREAVELLTDVGAFGIWDDDGDQNSHLESRVRAFLAKIDAEKGDGRAESEFQVISGDDEDAYIEAATRGPRDVALREAMRYAHQYAEDGPVKVVELVTVAMLAASRRQESE